MIEMNNLFWQLRSQIRNKMGRFKVSFFLIVLSINQGSIHHNSMSLLDLFPGEYFVSQISWIIDNVGYDKRTLKLWATFLMRKWWHMVIYEKSRVWGSLYINKVNISYHTSYVGYDKRTPTLEPLQQENDGIWYLKNPSLGFFLSYLTMFILIFTRDYIIMTHLINYQTETMSIQKDQLQHLKFFSWYLISLTFFFPYQLIVYNQFP